MWIVSELTRRRGALFADEAGRMAHELVAGDVVLTDAIELCDWAAESVHLEHCACCGGDDVSGSWITMRRAGDRILWLPDFRAMTREPVDFSLDEYRPPPYLEARGVAIFAEAELRRVLPELPEPDALRPLTRRDVALALQLESEPLLRRFPDAPRTERGWMIATSEPSLDETLDAFDALLSSWLEDETTPVELAPVDDADAVWIYADEPPGHDWRPLARRLGRLCPRFEPGWAAV